MRKWLLWLALSTLVFSPGLARSEAQEQAAEQPLRTFDVVSIRPSQDSDGPNTKFTKDGFIAKSATLQQLLAIAYSLRDDQIVNLPKWARTVNWAVNAKILDPRVAEAVTKLPWPDRHAMLQPLLAARFSVRLHLAAKKMRVFLLLTAEGGPKLELSEVQAGTSDARHNGLPVGGARLDDEGEITTFSTTAATFATQLSLLLNQTVIDRTQLTKRYDIHLRWAADEMRAPAQTREVSDNPGLFTAIQEQLGLKLLPSKAPVAVVVVDEASYPSEN